MTRRPRRKFPLSVYLGIIKRQKGRCACGCREKLIAGEVHFDHIVELADEGEDTPENLQALKLHHHKKKTKAAAKARAKVKRIQAQGGLLKPKRSRQQQLIDKFSGLKEPTP